ncbi:MAG: hypothetical protein AB1554_14050 [Chloroflexota bacterium]
MKTQKIFTFLIFVLTACAPAVTPAPTATLIPTEATPIFTQTAMPVTETATPTISQQPPACTFPLAQTTVTESTPKEYTFSEPRMVLAANAGIEIVEWLPDSQRVLITRSIRNTPNENIELFNPQTDEILLLAVRRSDMWFRPAWIERLKSVVYSDRVIVSHSFGNDGQVIPSSIVERHQLWISHSDPANAQIFEDVQYSPAIVPHEWVTSSLAVRLDSSQIVYLKTTGEQPWRLYSRMVSQDALEAEQQSVIQWIYGGERGWLELSDEMVWRFGTSQIFFYSFASPTNQTLILDIDTGQVCALSFGGWVYFARWSPNGRYLAVIKSGGPKHPLGESYNLVVLDTATGSLYQIDSTKVGPPEMANCCMHIIEEVAWAPDNRHLAIIGTADFSGTGTHVRHDRLYLVDFLSGEVDNLFPTFEIISNYPGTGLAWSPDGSKLLATCPTQKEGRLCLIPVHVDEQ